MRTKKFLSVICSVLIAFSAIVPLVSTSSETAGAAAVQSGEAGIVSGDFEYAVLDDGTVSITGYTGFAEELEIPSEIDGMSVRQIGDFAFTRCESLTSVAIPDTVNLISKLAFSYCSNLKSITIPDSVVEIDHYAFFECTSLDNVVIPDSVTKIEESAFSLCSGLKSITIPDSITVISNFMFADCTSLNNVVIPDSVTQIGYSVFSGCTSLSNIVIPDTVSQILPNAFAKTAWYNNQPDGYVYAGKVLYNYKGEMPENTKLSVKEGTLSISDAFYECRNLQSIDIPDSVISISNLFLKACSSLQSINVSGNNKIYSSDDGVLYSKDKTELIRYPAGKVGDEYTVLSDTVTIKSETFKYNSELKSVIIPDSVTAIEDMAFCNCEGLQSVTLPDSIAEIGEAVFMDCSGLQSMTFPVGLTTIPEGTFSGCINLKEAVIPDGVTTIGSAAFYECTSLNNVTLPDSVIAIGSSAFWQCGNLGNITIPDSVVLVGNGAFDNTAWYNNKLVGIVYAGKVLYGYKGDMSIDTSLMVDDGTVSISDYAFFDQTSLLSIIIPASVTIIGNNVFNTDYLKTIYGYAGTEAERYANENGIKFVPLDPEKMSPGDVNGDGLVDVNDATLIQKVIAGNASFTAEQFEFADTYPDGEVNISDVTAVQKYAAGLITGF